MVLGVSSHVPLPRGWALLFAIKAKALSRSDCSRFARAVCGSLGVVDVMEDG